MNVGDEYEKLKFLGIGLVVFVLLMIKSCETIQYKLISEEAEATVTGIVERRGRYGSVSYRVEYLVEMPDNSFGGSSPVSPSDFGKYPKGKKLRVLVLHPDRPFPNTIIKGHENSVWLFLFIGVTGIIVFFLGRIFLSAYR